MTIVKPALISLGLIAAMLAVSAWAWPHTPALVPVHFGADGQVDRMGSRAEALLMLPATATVMALLMAALPWLMPRNSRLERSQAPYLVGWLGTVLLLAGLHVAMAMNAVGAPVDVARIAVGLVGALLAVIGNYMGKARYNYVVGLRTPWTLSSEAVWDRTHRLFGPWTMLGGLAIVIAAVLIPPSPSGHQALLAVTLAGALVPAVIATVYSFILSRRQEGGRSGIEG